MENAFRRQPTKKKHQPRKIYVWYIDMYCIYVPNFGWL